MKGQLKENNICPPQDSLMITLDFAGEEIPTQFMQQLQNQGYSQR